MKSAAQSTLYFSAYPLKAITGSTSSSDNESPYLKAVLAGNKATSRASRIRVYPMANPYPKISAVPLPRVAPAKEVDSTDKEWFNHYE